MKLSEISQWVGLLSVGKIDDGVARFGKKTGELAGRDLVAIEPTDPRFAQLALEYDPHDKSRLLFLDARFAKPEALSHAQLVKRFGQAKSLLPPVDDFSGESVGTYFVFSEGKERFCLSAYFTGKVEDTVDVSRLTLRRVLDFAFAEQNTVDDEAAPT